MVRWMVRVNSCERCYRGDHDYGDQRGWRVNRWCRQHNMSLGDATSAYTLLTIGDGLVAQIPALIISTAAGVIVTRVATDEDIG